MSAIFPCLSSHSSNLQQQALAALAIAVDRAEHLPTSLPRLPSSSASRAMTLPSWSYIVYLFACSKPKITVPHSTLRAITKAGCPTTSCTWAAVEAMICVQHVLHLLANRQALPWLPCTFTQSSRHIKSSKARLVCSASSNATVPVAEMLGLDLLPRWFALVVL